MNTAQLQKREIRVRTRALRDAAPAASRASWSAAICALALAHPAYRAAHTLHIFLSFQSEIDTSAIIKHALASGRRVLVPLFEKGNPLTLCTQIDTLDPAAFDIGRWGMRTPKAPRPVDLKHIDVCFVPMLAYAPMSGRQFVRIGYGAGYYDRMLARLRPETSAIGLAFALQKVDSAPLENHDQLLTTILTES